jgi:hypothetical protein
LGSALAALCFCLPQIAIGESRLATATATATATKMVRTGAWGRSFNTIDLVIPLEDEARRGKARALASLRQVPPPEQWSSLFGENMLKSVERPI